METVLKNNNASQIDVFFSNCEGAELPILAGIMGKSADLQNRITPTQHFVSCADLRSTKSSLDDSEDGRVRIRVDHQRSQVALHAVLSPGLKHRLGWFDAMGGPAQDSPEESLNSNGRLLKTASMSIFFCPVFGMIRSLNLTFTCS